MKLKAEDIQGELERVLQILAVQQGNEIIAKIRPILAANIDRNRLQSFTEDNLDRVHEYVRRVLAKYIELSRFIEELQTERTTEVWQPLREQMQIWAYNFFLRKGFYRSVSTQEIASECTDEAAMFILNAFFPYDTDFGSWAHVIVQNTCLKFMRNEMKKSIVPPQNIIELDERLSTADDPIKQDQKHKDDERELLEAIGRLSQARRQVIELLYFEGLSLPEIAAKMNKTVSAVHSLHFNALKNLRKILDANRNNIYE